MRFLLLSIAFLLGAQNLFAQPKVKWKKVATFPGHLMLNTVCPLPGFDVALGGFYEDHTERRFFKILDGKVAEWEVPYPGKGFAKNILFYKDSVLYCGGGLDSNKAGYSQNDFWKLDLKTKQWQRLKDLDFYYLDRPSVFVDSDKIWLVVARFTDKELKQPGTAIYTYDTGKDSWEKTDTGPNSSLILPRSFVIGGDIYLFFEGQTYANQFSGALYSFNKMTHAWKKCSPYPGEARIASVPFVYSGMGFIAGGTNLPSSNNMATVYGYDPITDSWRKAGFLPAGVSAATAWQGHDGGIYVGFGKPNATDNCFIWELVEK